MWFKTFCCIGQEHSADTRVTLGGYKVSGTPRVQLASQANDGTGDDDVAWDAVAFQPIGSKPKQSDANLGDDSYTSGEGTGAYSAESNKDYPASADQPSLSSRNPSPVPGRVVR